LIHNHLWILAQGSPIAQGTNPAVSTQGLPPLLVT